MSLVKFDNNKYWMKGYKIRIYPTESQALIIDKRIELGIAVYNWTIEQEKEQYELFKANKSDKKFLSYFDLIRKFTDYRRDNPWLHVLPYGSSEKSIHRAFEAFEMFFKTKNRFPKFKSKKHLRKKSYGIRHDTMYFDGNMLRIEGFPRGEMIYTKWNHFNKRDKIKYYNPVITKDNLNRYFISFSILVIKPDNSKYCNNSSIFNPIGIDLNVRDRFVCSNGYRSGSPDLTKLKKRYLKANKKVHKDINRRLKEARTKHLEYSAIEYSKRSIKRSNKRKKILNKISNIVENFIQNETNNILEMKPSVIIMEDLIVSEMQRNHKIAISIHESNFNRCITVMRNKCDRYNIPFILADKTFPSSQICSNCGNRKKIFSSKIYHCPNCGIKIDRDLNAATNLMKLAY